MTKEKLNEANEMMAYIRELERLCKYEGINANGGYAPVHLGIIAEKEFKDIIQDANDRIRKRAEEALECARKEFDEL